MEVIDEESLESESLLFLPALSAKLGSMQAMLDLCGDEGTVEEPRAALMALGSVLAVLGREMELLLC